MAIFQDKTLYKNEENIWRIENNISNSARNLTLHILGNLHTFIGKEIGKTNYVRERALEFSKRDVLRLELINEINATITMVKTSITRLTEDAMRDDYPVLKFSKIETNEYLLVHLIKHLTYHLGQINYHRRLIEN